jgi:RHS repeat-associated protein
VFDRVIKRDINGQVLLSVYNNHHVWADYTAAGQAVARYLYGEQYDELLARWRTSDGLAWQLLDRQGTVRDLWRNGTLVGRREFDAFGRILLTATDGFADRFAFQGREWEAAAGRYWFRARWYDPQQRQFTSEDPLGFGAADANLRRFVFNAPTMYRDPSGTVAAVDYADLLRNSVLIGAGIGALCAALDAFARGKTPTLAELIGGAFAGAIIGAVLAAVPGAGPSLIGFGGLMAAKDLVDALLSKYEKESREKFSTGIGQVGCLVIPLGVGAHGALKPPPTPKRAPAKPVSEPSTPSEPNTPPQRPTPPDVSPPTVPTTPPTADVPKPPPIDVPPTKVIEPSPKPTTPKNKLTESFDSGNNTNDPFGEKTVTKEWVQEKFENILKDLFKNNGDKTEFGGIKSEPSNYDPEAVFNPPRKQSNYDPNTREIIYREEPIGVRVAAEEVQHGIDGAFKRDHGQKFLQDKLSKMPGVDTNSPPESVINAINQEYHRGVFERLVKNISEKNYGLGEFVEYLEGFIQYARENFPADASQ